MWDSGSDSRSGRIASGRIWEVVSFERRKHMARRTVLTLVIMGLAMLGASCATTTPMAQSYPAIEPVSPPSPGHTLKVDNLLVISDISRSMRNDGKVGIEKALLTSFNNGIPEGLKNAGMRTFGKSTYYHTVLIQPLDRYDRSAMAGLVGDLQAGCGNTPLAAALVKGQDDLEESAGNIAVVVVSDGENLSCDPIFPTLALKEIYGDRLCVHTIHVGDCQAGRKILNEVARHSGCGIAVTAADLQSRDAMEKFITDVFYRHEVVDSDGDGVPDWLDKCAGTPKGVEVDKDGCPLDSDGDGVPDYRDKCPDTPKGVEVDSDGCPLDSDGDGVLNHQDKCPDTPAGVKVDKDGCPLDTDGDGVPDYKDQCPDTLKGAPVNSVGCWSIKGINFDYDKSDIKPQYHGLLNENVEVLKKNPSVTVEIEGHTDSVGSDGYNQALSERRAESVRAYFVSSGISAQRISTRGFGESKPIVSNETAEGRAQNRRIDIKVISR